MLIPAKNLSPVLLSPAIIVHRCRWYRRKIYHRCHCHRRSFFSGVNNTGEKFIANINNPGAPPFKENPWERLIAGVNNTTYKFVSRVVDTAKHFIASVVDTADKHSFAIISANFRKKLKWSLWNTQGLGGHCFMKKKLSLKSCVRLPLRNYFSKFYLSKFNFFFFFYVFILLDMNVLSYNKVSM